MRGGVGEGSPARRARSKASEKAGKCTEKPRPASKAAANLGGKVAEVVSADGVMMRGCRSVLADGAVGGVLERVPCLEHPSRRVEGLRAGDGEVGRAAVGVNVRDAAPDEQREAAGLPREGR